MLKRKVLSGEDYSTIETPYHLQNGREFNYEERER